MSEPIKIVVTADTAQAAAAMTQFVTQAGSGLRVLSAGGTVADGSLKQLRESALGLREGFHALETGVYLLGGQRFPALAESVMGVRSTMMLARTAALLTGASLGVVSATIAALGAALLPTAIFGWRAYTAAQDEARSKSDLLNQSLMLQSRLTEQINNLNKAGYLDDADMLLIQNARDQAEMANPDDPNAGNKAQQKYLMDRGFTKPAIEAMNELIKLQHQLHEESLTGFDGERQKAKEELDQRLADIKAYAKEAGPLLYSRDAQGSDATVAGNNFSKKIAGIDTAEQTQKAREAIEALKDQQAETTGDALAGKQKREGFTEEEFGNWTAAIHDLQKKYTLAEDVLTEANKYGVAQRVAGIKSETAEQKKLNDEKKQAAQLQAEIARAEIEAKLKGIEGNPLLTKQEKDQKSLPLYKQEMSDDEGLKADQLAIQNDPAKTDLEKSDAKKEYNKLLDQQAELENKIKAIEGENSFAYNWLADIAALQSKLPTLAQSMASVFVSPFNGMQSGFNSAITQMMEHGGTFKNFMLTLGTGIEKSFIQSVSSMVSSYVTGLATMLVKAIASEAAHTAASVAGSNARAASSYAEGEKHLFATAMGAAKSVASIPYVGWALALAAFASVEIAGNAILAATGGPGFYAGGYTGDGGTNEIAGVVHRGEFVVPASTVNRIGLGPLEAMTRGESGGNGGGSGSSAKSGSNVNLHFWGNMPPHPKDYFNSSEGKNHFIKLSREARTKIGIPT